MSEALASESAEPLRGSGERRQSMSPANASFRDGGKARLNPLVSSLFCNSVERKESPLRSL